MAAKRRGRVGWLRANAYGVSTQKLAATGATHKRLTLFFPVCLDIMRASSLKPTRAGCTGCTVCRFSRFMFRVFAMAMTSTIRKTSADSPGPLGFDELLGKIDREFARFAPDLIESFNFEYDGVAFSVRRIKQDKHSRLLINAHIGFLPFSIESAERRQAIKTIVLSTNRLNRVRFSIDTAGRITAGAIMDSKPAQFPDFIFYPLMLFLQETRPFMQLIGAYMQPSAPIPPAAAEPAQDAVES